MMKAMFPYNYGANRGSTMKKSEIIKRVNDWLNIHLVSGNFSEQFPSLKGKECCGVVVDWRPCLRKKGEPHEHKIVPEFFFYKEGVVMEHCLDKQRVKDAISVEVIKHLGFSGEVSIHIDTFCKGLRKRLGLED